MTHDFTLVSYSSYPFLWTAQESQDWGGNAVEKADDVSGVSSMSTCQMTVLFVLCVLVFWLTWLLNLVFESPQEEKYCGWDVQSSL